MLAVVQRRPQAGNGLAGVKKQRFHNQRLVMPVGSHAVRLGRNPLPLWGWQRVWLFHQQSLPRAFYGSCKAPLIVRWQAGVFARQDSPGLGHELGEEGGVFEIEHVNGEIDFWLGPRCTDFTVVGCSGWAIRMCFSWHNNLRGSTDHLTSL